MEGQIEGMIKILDFFTEQNQRLARLTGKLCGNPEETNPGPDDKQIPVTHTQKIDIFLSRLHGDLNTYSGYLDTLSQTI